MSARWRTLKHTESRVNLTWIRKCFVMCSDHAHQLEYSQSLNCVRLTTKDLGQKEASSWQHTRNLFGTWILITSSDSPAIDDYCNLSIGATQFTFGSLVRKDVAMFSS